MEPKPRSGNVSPISPAEPVPLAEKPFRSVEQQPIIVVQPVPVLVPNRPEKPVRNQPVLLTETRPISAPKQPSKEFGNNSQNNSPKNSESELFPNSFEPAQPGQGAKPAPTMPIYKKIGKVGRKRKYEETGIRGEIPVRDVVLFRHIKRRHWPGMSQDMQEWYEFYYFKKPVRTERAKDATDYERHVRAWERGRAWIADHEQQSGNQATEALGDSRKVVAYRKRQTG